MNRNFGGYKFQEDREVKAVVKGRLMTKNKNTQSVEKNGNSSEDEFIWYFAFHHKPLLKIGRRSRPSNIYGCGD
jgi:hypothetical protein